MKVYTVAGNLSATSIGDGGPATSADLGTTEGIWMDGFCNLYISDLGQRRIRKVNGLTQIITTVAGGNGSGYTGDYGPATNAKIVCYGIYADALGNIYFADPTNYVVRKIDGTTGIISTIAGGGSSLANGIPATSAQLHDPSNVYGDNAGNIYIGESRKIRRVNTSGIITTIAGTGIAGLSGDGGMATSAQVNYPHGMLFDDAGNFYFADRVNHRIRKIDQTGKITTIAGSSDGLSGDGGPATAAKLSGPISFVIDYLGNILIGDNQNNLIRKLDAVTGIITTIAGVGPSITGDTSQGALATAAEIHPEFMYLDRSGNIYFSNFGFQIHKITNYYPALPNSTNDCGETAVPEFRNQGAIEISPNPAQQILTVATSDKITSVVIMNLCGQFVQKNLTAANAKETTLDIRDFPSGIYIVKVNGVYAGRFVKE